MQTGVERRNAAFVFTDLVGYSALSQRDEALALELIEEHKAFLRPLFATHSGKEVKFLGDGFFLEFPDSAHALACAIEIQQALFERNLAMRPERRLQVRIGINEGEAAHTEGDVFGDAVNIASRLEKLAPPGGIFVSSQVASAVQNRLETPLDRVGKAHLKNIGHDVEVFSVRLPWQPRNAFRSSTRIYLTHRKTSFAIALSVLTLAGIGTYLSSRTSAAGQLPAKETTRLAVLPFESAGPSAKEDIYFARGIATELSNKLQAVHSLKVVSQSAVDELADNRQDIKDIARRMHVSTLVEGTVEKTSDRVRITARLIDAQDQEQIWSKEFDVPGKDIFAAQSDAAGQIASALAAKLSPEETHVIAQPPTTNMQAYDLYLRAKFKAETRVLSAKDAYEAIDELKRAIALDPRFADAYALLASEYLAIATDFDPSRTDLDESAYANCMKALSLRSNLASAHITMGDLLGSSLHGNDFVGAIREYKAAAISDPEDFLPHADLAVLYGGIGLPELAKSETSLGEDRGWDPDNIRAVQRWNDVYEGDYRHALDVPRTRYENDEGWAMITSLALLESGKIAEATARAKWGLAQPNGEAHGYLHSILAILAAKRKDVPARDHEIQQALKANTRFFHIHATEYNVALAYAVSGDANNAMTFLRKASHDGFPNLPLFQREPLFNAIRNDPGYVRFIGDLQPEWEQIRSAAEEPASIRSA